MSKKILIIDDDLDLCTLLGRFLTKNGYEVEAAHSGAKGIAKFSAGKFDLVICDYRLGDMEGIKVLTTLRQQNPGVNQQVVARYYCELFQFLRYLYQKQTLHIVELRDR